MRLRLSKQAEADIRSILKDTKRLFGERQLQAYAALIEGGLRLIAEDSSRPTCLKRDEIRKGVRSFHLEQVTGRRHSASHLVYFMEIGIESGERELVVIGVLHERMEPKSKLSKSLRNLDSET